jgi:hypothetical protein
MIDRGLMPRRILCLATACASLMQLSIAPAATALRGEIRTCRDYADLDYALDHPNSSYFKGWTSKDFDAAETWVSSCFASPPTKEDLTRQSLLAQRRAALEGRGEIQGNEDLIRQMQERELQDQREQEAQVKAAAAERAAEEAKERAEEAKVLAAQRAEQARQHAAEAKELADRKAKQAAHDECLRSSAYQRYAAQVHILNSLDQESRAQQALDHEKRVEDASGTINLYAKRIAGESLVSAQDDLNKWWAEYQRYGGDAKSPASVPRSSGDPCN